ncbi:hypothetical protein ACPUER_19965 [Burkholderia sp. DN3021]|uniref:hypothetical protein n=1 Tax=Burkholderia sp. DN3021 TaxID=3410137 RepID=UPI003C7BB021
MAKYSIREVRLESGGRFPLLVHDDPLGLPAQETLEYWLAKLRARGLRRASIRHRTRALERLTFSRAKVVHLKHRVPQPAARDEFSGRPVRVIDAEGREIADDYRTWIDEQLDAHIGHPECESTHAQRT